MYNKPILIYRNIIVTKTYKYKDKKYEKVSTGQVEVGDLIVTESGIHKSVFEITRVTKTMALSKRKDDNYELRFQRNISNHMHCPQQEYPLTHHTVLRLIDKDDKNGTS